MADALPPMEDFDDIFWLPDGMFGDALDDARVDPQAVAARETARRLRTTYEVVVNRLRRDSNAISPTMIQVLLMERIALNYVQMRAKEAAAGTQAGFAHATAQKDYNTFWLAMVQEYNKQTKSTDSEFRDQLVQQLGTIVSDVIALIDDPSLRQAMSAKFKESLQSAGL